MSTMPTLYDNEVPSIETDSLRDKVWVNKLGKMKLPEGLVKRHNSGSE